MREHETLFLEKLKNEDMESLTKNGRKKELEEYCIKLGFNKSGSSKALASNLLFWYDSKTYKDRIAQWNLKLEIDMKPGLFHGETVRNKIGELWRKKIRPEVLLQNNYTCAICSHKVEPHDASFLDVHEVESYDFKNVVCDLIGLEPICKSCHAFHHWNKTRMISNKERLERLKLHFAKVNGVSVNVFDEYVRLRRVQFEVESNQETMQSIKDHANDLCKINDLFNQPVVRFKVSGEIPYKNEVIEKLKKKNLYFEY